MDKLSKFTEKSTNLGIADYDTSKGMEQEGVNFFDINSVDEATCLELEKSFLEIERRAREDEANALAEASKMWYI